MNLTQDDVVAIIDGAGVSVDVSSIQPGMSLVDAGVDSLEMMNVYMAIEDKFGIKIPDEDIDELNSINNIVEYIRKL